VIEKDSGLQQDEATQINTIKNLDYPEFNKIGIFWLFFRDHSQYPFNNAVYKSYCGD